MGLPRLLGPLAFGHVAGGTDKFNGCAGCVENGMTYAVDVLDGAVRKNRPENHLMAAFFTDRPFPVLHQPVTIVLMNALQ
jgi:hypothetical protein